MKRKITKKNIYIAILTIVTMLAFSGCESLNYTDEQENIIADYAANIVLRQDANYKYDYVKEEPTTQEEVTTKALIEEETSPADNVSDNSQQTVDSSEINATTDITGALQLPAGITAEYAGCEVTSQYPNTQAGSNVFVMKAVENSNLLVVKFKLNNTTSQDVTINMMEKIQKYKGIVNDNKRYNAQLTLLMDALNTYEGTLAAGSTQTFVLIYQTQLDSENDISNLTIAITDNSGNEIALKLK